MVVKFWPKTGTIPTRICNHRYDAAMTFTHQTDTIATNSVYAAELWGFKNNMRLGIFASNVDGSVADVTGREATGLARHDIYFPTDRWSPDGGAPVVIPDYNATAWTAAGAAAFSGATAGAAKAARTPNHGQQLFNISGGQYGYDSTTGTPGLSNLSEFTNVVNWLNDWLFGLVGRQPSGFSYRNGQTAMSTLAYQEYLGGRDSRPGSAPTGDANTFYGLDAVTGVELGLPAGSTFARSTFGAYPSSSRWYDFWNAMGMTKANADSYVQAQIALTLANHGWYKDFMHWHNGVSDGQVAQIDYFLALCRAAFGANFVWTCSHGEALEYMYIRGLASRVNTVQRDGAVTVLVDVVDEFKSLTTNGLSNAVPMAALNTPLTVEVDLTGTALAGIAVKSSYGKPISKGSNIYLVEVPFKGDTDGFAAVTLSADTSGHYLDLNRPSGSASLSAGKITVTTDMPTKAVLFSGSTEAASVVADRSNEFSTGHTFTVGSGTFRVGIINEAGQSRLITVA